MNAKNQKVKKPAPFKKPTTSKILSLAFASVMPLLSLSTMESFAQTCSAPVLLVGQAISSNTCGSTNSYPSTSAPDHVYHFYVEQRMIPQNQSPPLAVAPFGNFDASLVFSKAECPNGTILDEVDDKLGSGFQAAEVINTGALNRGHYFVIVTSNSNAMSCGDYSLVIPDLTDDPDGLFQDDFEKLF